MGIAANTRRQYSMLILIFLLFLIFSGPLAVIFWAIAKRGQIRNRKTADSIIASKSAVSKYSINKAIDDLSSNPVDRTGNEEDRLRIQKLRELRDK
jgi:hypothetical protein